MADEIQIFEGVIKWNANKLYAGGKKKMVQGTITIPDTIGNPTDYQFVSFRSQVSIQSAALGDNGMRNIKCRAHGVFKENTYNGKTTWQLMMDKIELEGHEQLAIDAENAANPLPAVPVGTLNANPMQPVAQQPMPQSGPVPVSIPVVPMPLPTSGAVPVTNGPVVVAGGYIAPDSETVRMRPIPTVQQVPVQPYVAPVTAAPNAPVNPTMAAPTRKLPVKKEKALLKPIGDIPPPPGFPDDM